MIKPSKLAKIAGIALIPIALLSNYKEICKDSCECGSFKVNYQWRIGMWPAPSLPLTNKSSEIEESRVYQDFFRKEPHVHNWEFYQASPYYCFGIAWGGCAIGKRNLASDTLCYYEKNPEFREYIQKQIKDNKLDPNQLKLWIINANKSGKDSAESLRQLEELEEGYSSYRNERK